METIFKREEGRIFIIAIGGYIYLLVFYHRDYFVPLRVSS